MQANAIFYGMSSLNTAVYRTRGKACYLVPFDSVCDSLNSDNAVHWLGPKVQNFAGVKFPGVVQELRSWFGVGSSVQ